MTREEAIKELELIAKVTIWNDRRLAVEMAIEALSADEEKENGRFVNRDNCNINCNDSNRTLVEVVRCKDCIQKHIGGSVTHYYWCDLWDREVDGTDFCAWGERREE